VPTETGRHAPRTPMDRYWLERSMEGGCMSRRMLAMHGPLLRREESPRTRTGKQLPVTPTVPRSSQECGVADFGARRVEESPGVKCVPRGTWIRHGRRSLATIPEHACWHWPGMVERTHPPTPVRRGTKCVLLAMRIARGRRAQWTWTVRYSWWQPTLQHPRFLADSIVRTTEARHGLSSDPRVKSTATGRLWQSTQQVRTS
jgi:hypothetical protein